MQRMMPVHEPPAEDTKACLRSFDASLNNIIFPGSVAKNDS